MTEPTGRRTSPRVLLVHTVTFRQARQFVPAVIPIVAVSGFGGGRTTIIALVVGVTLLSLAHGGAQLVAVPLRRRPGRGRRHPGPAVPLGAHRPDRPDPRRGGGDAAAAPVVRPGARAHRRRRRGGERQRRGAGRRRRPPRGGRPPAHRRPPPPGPSGGRARRRTAAARRSRPRRRSPASTTGGCSTRRWWAATSPCPLAAVGAGLRVLDELRAVCSPTSTGSSCPTAGTGRGGLVGAAARPRHRRRPRRSGGQLALPAGPARRLADRRPRPAHPAAHRTGDRPDPRRHGHRGAGHALGAGRAGQLPWSPGSATPPDAASSCRSGPAPRPGRSPAGWSTTPARSPDIHRRPAGGRSCAPWRPACW